MLAFDFDNITSLSNPNEDVHFAIRPNVNLFSMSNWESFVPTYMQEPSVIPASFMPVFTPLQQFMDGIIHHIKTNTPSFLTYVYKQFPNLEYFMDTRLTVRFIFHSFIHFIN